MQLETASRKKSKLKMALQGPSGSGKTMSALLIAYGLCNSWQKIAVIDTENRSADLYAHLGPYNVLSMHSPHSPERYQEAIELCLQGGIEVVIIDSASHEWDYLLDFHSSLPGNSFTNWNKVTPRHQAFINTVLQSDVHVIATIRSKTEYVMTEKNGKQVPEKVGMKGVQRENLEYEFTLAFELDMTNRGKASKDRTGLFFGKPEFIPSVKTGKQLLEWCNIGETGLVTPPIQIPSYTQSTDLMQQVLACKTVSSLLQLYKQQPANLQDQYVSAFTERRNSLIADQNTYTINNSKV